MKKQLPKNRIPVSVSIPFDELQTIDQTAFTLDLSRSDFILRAVMEKIKKIKEEKQEFMKCAEYKSEQR